MLHKVKKFEAKAFDSFGEITKKIKSGHILPRPKLGVGISPSPKIG